MIDAPSFNGISPRVLRAKLACIGYIKIGGKVSGKRQPEKYNHFKIRTRARDQQGNYILDQSVHSKIGDKPIELDVRFLWDDPAQNFKSSLAAFSGPRKLLCEGNGERAFDRQLNKEIQCTCPLLKQHKGEYPLTTYPRPVGDIVCKPSGTLSVLLEAANYYGGYHIYRTTSWETISSLTAAFEHFKTIFNGTIAWIPFKLLLYPFAVSYEGGTGTAYGVTLALRGSMETAYQIAAQAREQRDTALRQLTAGFTPEEHAAQVGAIEEEDRPAIVSEFHPQATGDVEADYEIEEDDDDPLEAHIRLALELAKVAPERINKAVAEYSDRLGELALVVQTQRPEQWATAGQRLAEKQNESKPLGAGAAPLDLFGDG